MLRPHPVTGRTLVEILEEERPYLQPLPRVPYDTRDVVQRHVDSTAHILYETNLYPVAEEHIGQLVYVCIGPDRLEVFDRGVHAITELERIPDGAGRIAARDRRRRGRYDVTLLQERFAAWARRRRTSRPSCAVASERPVPSSTRTNGLEVTSRFEPPLLMCRSGQLNRWTGSRIRDLRAHLTSRSHEQGDPRILRVAAPPTAPACHA
ncbi:MAG TPA: hypothetical protein VK571_05505 [Gemmatimonadaceae bacterium]|nr:hypothetical protein [Gemmatimonadaceae bacterium]